jgi:hypothetical protein
MGKHRLVRVQDGVRWSQRASGNVAFSHQGELFRVDGSTVAWADREVAVGDFWEEWEA